MSCWPQFFATLDTSGLRASFVRRKGQIIEGTTAGISSKIEQNLDNTGVSKCTFRRKTLFHSLSLGAQTLIRARTEFQDWARTTADELNRHLETKRYQLENKKGWNWAVTKNWRPNKASLTKRVDSKGFARIQVKRTWAGPCLKA